MLGKRLINTKVAGGGGCTDIVDNYDPFGGNGVALYQLNGNANDVSGNYNGTASNVTYGTGVFGQAGVFNGSSSYIDTPLNINNIVSNVNDRTQDLTFSCWFKANSIPSVDGQILYLGNYTQYTPVYHTFSIAYTSSGDLSFGVFNGTSFFVQTPLSINNWHQVVGVRESGVIKLYVNGSFISQITQTSDTSINSSATLKFGSGQTVGLTDGKFNGSIDQVRIFNTALTPLEVEALYTEELCICDGTVDTLDILGDGSCIATYPLDGNANDLSGNYSGTPTDVTYGVGEFDLAGVFNGSSSYVLANGLQSLYNSNQTSSISFWFKTTTAEAQEDYMFIDFSGYFNYAIAIKNSKVFVNTRVDGNGALDVIFNSTANYNDGNWHHIVVSKNNSTLQRTIYIDNQLLSTQTILATAWSATPQVSFGCLFVPPSTVLYPFNGSIDQVRIFNKALSASEVTTLYNETACSIPNPIENASFHYDPTTLSDGAVTSWNDGGSINRSLDLVSGTTTISKVTSGGIGYVDFPYTSSDSNVSFLRTGGSTLTTYPDYPTNTSFTWVQFANINTAYNNNESYPYLASIFNTLESENGVFQPHIWRSGLSFSYRLGLIMNNGSRFYDINLATSSSDVRPYGTWKMIGITFEYNQSATSYVKIYIDGALVETWSNTGTWGVSNNTLMVGARQYSGGQRGGYQIGDTLGFVGEAKTQSEIAEIYRLLKGKYGL